MIIDIHAHAAAFPKLKCEIDNKKWLQLSGDELIQIMDLQGVAKAVLLPSCNAESTFGVQSIGEILYICEKYPGRFIPFCNIDPRLARNPNMVTEKDFEFLLDQYVALGCKGVGEMMARISWNHPLMVKLLKACNKFRLPFTFHTITEDIDSYGVLDEIGLGLLEGTLREFSDIKFFGHSQCFWSEISGDIKNLSEKKGYPNTPVKPGGRVPELMRKYQNLYGDLSAGSGLNSLKRDLSHAYEFLDEFQDKLMLGLDNCLSGETPLEHIHWFKSILEQGRISHAIYEKIMWKNANRLLELGLE